MADPLKNPQQLETYRKMLDSMVQFLQISSNLIRQRVQTGIPLDCEVECVMCQQNQKCAKCLSPPKATASGKTGCPAQESCIQAAKAQTGASQVSQGEEAVEKEAAEAKSGEDTEATGKSAADDNCICEQLRTIKSAISEHQSALPGESKECSKEKKRKCGCGAKRKKRVMGCACPTDDEKESLHQSLIGKLEAVQKQIDLVRVDVENLSGKSKSAALYKEIMKGSSSKTPPSSPSKQAYSQAGGYPVASTPYSNVERMRSPGVSPVRSDGLGGCLCPSGHSRAGTPASLFATDSGGSPYAVGFTDLSDSPKRSPAKMPQEFRQTSAPAALVGGAAQRSSSPPGYPKSKHLSYDNEPGAYGGYNYVPCKNISPAGGASYRGQNYGNLQRARNAYQPVFGTASSESYGTYNQGECSDDNCDNDYCGR